MKNAPRFRIMYPFIIILLIVNGAGALYGGYHFITDPTGSSLGMHTSLLKFGPFKDYFIPGTLLVICNGIGSFITLGLVLGKTRYAWLFLILQGCILLIWIIIQMVILQMVYPAMHYTFLIIGFFFTISGYFLKPASKTQNN